MITQEQFDALVARVEALEGRPERPTAAPAMVAARTRARIVALLQDAPATPRALAVSMSAPQRRHLGEALTAMTDAGTVGVTGGKYYLR